MFVRSTQQDIFLAAAVLYTKCVARLFAAAASLTNSLILSSLTLARRRLTFYMPVTAAMHGSAQT
eukprot:SAG11_NODE_346_length_10432_cov_4.883770_7_plen_65_part_00